MLTTLGQENAAERSENAMKFHGIFQKMKVSLS